MTIVILSDHSLTNEIAGVTRRLQQCESLMKEAFRRQIFAKFGTTWSTSMCQAEGCCLAFLWCDSICWSMCRLNNNGRVPDAGSLWKCQTIFGILKNNANTQKKIDDLLAQKLAPVMWELSFVFAWAFWESTLSALRILRFSCRNCQNTFEYGQIRGSKELVNFWRTQCNNTSISF